MDKVITMFFYEVINQIIPGVVFIGFYYNQEVEKAFQRFQHQDTIVVACILLTAWLIGIMLNAIIWFTFLYLGGKRLCGEGKNDKDIDDNHEHVRLKCIKQQAEVVMSRAMFVISLLTLFKHPNGFFAQEWHWYYSCYGILTFGPLFISGFVYARRKN